MRASLALIFAVAVGQLSAQDSELAIVRRIRERILSHPANGPARAYKVTIPGTTVSFDMVPVPGGEFRMGPDRARAVRVSPFWMQAHEVTWDEYRLFMFAVQAGEKPGIRIQPSMPSAGPLALMSK